MALTKVSSSLVSDNAITTGKLVDGGVHSADIATNAITSTKIAQNSILTKHIDDGQVTTAQLGADAVTAAKIADDAISEEHLDVTVITGLTEVTAATGDLLMVADISDSNNLKKIPVSSILAGTLTNAAQTNITSLGTLTSLNVDTISMNGSSIAASGNLTLDVAGDIILDADGQDVLFKDGGTQFGSIRKNGNNIQLMASIENGDITFHGDDGGSPITALSLDMSAAGAATFNGAVTLGASALTLNGSLGTWSVNAEGARMNFGRGSANYIDAVHESGYLVFQTSNGETALTLTSSQQASFTGTVTVAQNILSASSAPLVLTGDGGANIELYGNGTAYIDATTTTFRGTNGSGSGNISSGNISSGAITSTGASSFGNVTSLLDLNLPRNDGTSPAVVIGYFDRFRFITDSTGNYNESQLGVNPSNVLFTNNGYAVNTTTVIDSSRNLTNIGTISSGAITASNQVTVSNGSSTSTYGFRHEGAGKFMRMGMPNASFAYFETDSTNGFYLDGNTTVNGSLLTKNSDAFSVAGIALRGDVADFIRSENCAINVNRLSNNGDQIRFHQAGTLIGSIGSEGGDSVYMQGGTSSGAGLLFHGGAGKVLPVRNGASVDATIDLGQSSRQFKDLYLSGTISSGAITSSSLFTNTYANGNISAPSTSDHTAGTRQVYYDGSATAWYARGIEGNTLWDNVDQDWKLYRQGSVRLQWNEANDSFNINSVREYRKALYLTNNVAYTFDIDVKSIGASGQVMEVFAGYTHYGTSYAAVIKQIWSQRSTAQSDVVIINNTVSHSTSQAGAWSFTYVDANTVRLTKSAGTYGGGGHGYIALRGTVV